MQNIQVMARVRPMLSREVGDVEAVHVDAQTVFVQSEPKVHRYTFDAVFDGNATQADIFAAAAPYLDFSLQGLNTTIFTYGQTGTGKTHTMLGHDLWELASTEDGGVAESVDLDGLARNEAIKGLIPRAMQYLFRAVGRGGEQSDSRGSLDELGASQLSVQYLEIYNEKVHDLLREYGSAKVALELREDREGNIGVPEATELVVESEQEVLATLWAGARNRAMNATEMNEVSSRSHTIFQVNMERVCEAGAGREGGGDEEAEGGDTVIRRSKINLVDLAGSEKWRVHDTDEMSEQRIQELTAINQSLSNLGNVISALLQPGRSHIPYRNSKLTRLLQDSLGGNTRTVFIVTLSPVASAVQESVSSLQFADRAKKVTVHARVNEELHGSSVGDKLKKYEHEIARLKAELRDANTSLAVSGSTLSGAQEHAQGQGSAMHAMTSVVELRQTLHLERREKHALLELLRTSGGQRNGDGNEAESVVVAGVADASEEHARAVEEMEREMARRSRHLVERAEWLEAQCDWLSSLSVTGVSRSGHQASEQDADGSQEARLKLSSSVELLEGKWRMQAEELAATKQHFLTERELVLSQLQAQDEELAAVQEELQIEAGARQRAEAELGEMKRLQLLEEAEYAAIPSPSARSPQLREWQLKNLRVNSPSLPQQSQPPSQPQPQPQPHNSHTHIPRAYTPTATPSQQPSTRASPATPHHNNSDNGGAAAMAPPPTPPPPNVKRAAALLASKLPPPRKPAPVPTPMHGPPQATLQHKPPPPAPKPKPVAAPPAKPPPPPPRQAVWTKIKDPASKAFYYYNQKTGVTTWDKPAECS